MYVFASDSVQFGGEIQWLNIDRDEFAPRNVRFVKILGANARSNLIVRPDRSKARVYVLKLFRGYTLELANR